MTTKQKPSDWIDPDDVPHWAGKEFSDGTWQIGEREVTPAEARAEVRRRARLQTRMNDALREWLRTHPGHT